MSSFNFAKKLLPAKKAWKSFNTKFQAKFQKLRTSRAIKRTKRCCIETWRKIRDLIVMPQKFHALISRPRHHFHCHHHQRYMGINSASAIYVDELFPGRVSMHNADLQYRPLAQLGMSPGMVASSSSSGNQTGERPPNSLDQKNSEKMKGCETSSSTRKLSVYGRGTPLMLPQLRCVDERADEFISKVRQGLKLEREQSIVEFQEMLARST